MSKAFSAISNFVSANKKNQPATTPLQLAPAASPAPTPARSAPAPARSAPSPYAAPIKLDRSGVSKEFDVHREKAAQAENATLQGQKDALARRAAQLGGGPSGALIKQEALATDAMGRRLGDANAMINSAQSAELRRIGEMEQGLNFQREERLAGQEFQQGQFDKTFDLQKQAADAQSKQWQSTFDFTKGQTEFENDVNVKQNILTQLQNLKNSGYNPDQIEAIFDSLGLSALGINLGNINGVTDRPPMVMPTSAGFGAQAKAIEANTKNGYTPEEMRAAGITRA